MSKILSERIKDLHLRPDAPYPSEVRDGHDMVRQWRQSQRLHLVAESSAREVEYFDHDDPDLDHPGAA